MASGVGEGVPILPGMASDLPTPPDDDALGREAPPQDAPAEPRGTTFVQPSHGGLDETDPWDATAPTPPTASVGREDRGPWWVAPLRSVLDVLDVAVLALVMLVCVQFLAHNYVVDGPSMQPTFHDGDFVIVNRMAYRSFDLSWLPGVDNEDWQPFGDPEPGDVIVFLQVSSGEGRQLIKRVIAVPGQTVEVAGGAVLIDGVPIEEPYISAPPTYTYPPTEVGPDELFVLGDNRINSADSHNFGTIRQDQVVGRADVRYWPAGRIGLIDHVIGEAVVQGRQVTDIAGSAGRGLAAAWW